MVLRMALREQFAYERVESRLEALISGGALGPGDRIPSVRELCRMERISPATAIQALTNLEARSLIFARPRSGFYVHSRPHLPLPTPAHAVPRPQRPKVSEHVAQVFRDFDNPRTIALGAGIPHPSLLPTAEVARCVSRAARQYATEFGRYGSRETDLGLRKEIALRLSLAGCTMSPDEIVITTGCMDALNLAVRAVANPGDTVLVESPTFFGILQMLESLGMKVISVPSTCDRGLDIAAFERALSRYRIATCILIPSFGNPHGASLDDERRQKVVDLAARHGIPIIEDDIYAELGFDNSRHRPLRTFGNSGDNLLCGSLSKTLSPGLRIGWVAGGRYAEDVHRLKLVSSITTPQVTARAAADYLRSGGFDRHLRGLRKMLETQMCRISAAIARSFPQGTALSRPGGGYFLWVELPERVDSLRLRDAASHHGISICPGPIFSHTGEFSHFIRVNCAIEWSPAVETALQTLGQLAHEQNDSPPKKS
ncbi:GntR family transcriptional regulator [Spartobacteria bacterium LR76]|nr:GntR family transcriptional regulator [Spartobacteria bacterium LR76]